LSYAKADFAAALPCADDRKSGSYPIALRAPRGHAACELSGKEEVVTTIVCGVDESAGARAAVRVAWNIAQRIGGRLVAVHVLDRLLADSPAAERVAAEVLYQEVPDAHAEARGEVGDVAERLAAVAREEDATLIVLGARSRGRSRTYLRARCAAELSELTLVPIVIAPVQVAAVGSRARETKTGEEAKQ
jgi:nucleotide-binding universal stress UspA family protein